MTLQGREVDKPRAGGVWRDDEDIVIARREVGGFAVFTVGSVRIVTMWWWWRWRCAVHVDADAFQTVPSHDSASTVVDISTVCSIYFLRSLAVARRSSCLLWSGPRETGSSRNIESMCRSCSDGRCTEAVGQSVLVSGRYKSQRSKYKTKTEKSLELGAREKRRKRVVAREVCLGEV